MDKNLVANLEDYQIEDPMRVIRDFFSFTWLPRHLQMLEQWRDAVALEERPNIKEWPTELLFHHELIVNLLEASWLLRNDRLGKIFIKEGRENDIAKDFIKRETKTLRDYPKRLKIRETIMPYKVLKKTFSQFSLDDYRRILKTWVYDALSSKWSEDSLCKYEIIPVYDNLARLFEACWLIHEREKGEKN